MKIKFLFTITLLLYFQAKHTNALRFQVQQFMIGGSGSGSGKGQSTPTCVGNKCSGNNPCSCAHTECQRFRCVCQENTRELNGQCVSYDNGELGESCLPGKQCKPENSECYRGHCLCKQGYYEFGDQCKGILGEACESLIDCLGEHMDCVRRRCVCDADDGYIEINDHCVDETSWAACRIQTDPNQYCNSVIYGSVCNDTGCMCPPDYTEVLGVCKQNNRCVTSDDCDEFVSGSACEEGFCVCPNNTHNVNARCIPDNWCISDSDCNAELIGAICDNYVCSCGEGFKEEYDRCIPDKWCVLDSDCSVTNSSCEEYLCRCPYGFIEQGGACVSYGPVPGPIPPTQGCTDDTSCQSELTGGICNAYKQCECPFGFNQHGNLCVEGQCDAVSLGQPCWCAESCSKSINNSYCKQIMPQLSLCECRDQTFQWEGKCYHKRGLGEECAFSVQCGALDTYSRCDMVNKTCRCIHGYVDYQGVCYQKIGLGSTCSVEVQCDVGNSTCSSGNTCVCSDGFVQDATANTCYQTRSLDATCDEDVQCEEVDSNTFCNSGVCDCKSGNIRLDGQCLPVIPIGEPCNETIQCDASGTEYCNASKLCDCKSGYFYDASYAYNSCFLPKDFDELCEIDEQCTLVNPQTWCDANYRCSCERGTVRALHKCWTEQFIDDVCEVPEQCITENSECATNPDKPHIFNSNNTIYKYCQCKYGYYHINTTNCLPQASHGEACTVDEGCQMNSINYQYCDNGTCACTHNHFLHNATCYNQSPGLYEKCVNSSYCEGTDDRYTCMEGLCVCNKYSVEDIDCEPPGKLLADPGVRVGDSVTISSYHKYYLHEIGDSTIVNNFQVFFGYKSGEELWYEVVAPHISPTTGEEIQLQILFSGLVITSDVVFEMYYEPGLTFGQVVGTSNDELEGEVFITPFNRVLFKLNTAESNGWGFNSTVTAIAKGTNSMCDSTVDLSAQPHGYVATIESEDYPGTMSGHLHCYYHVTSTRNTIIEYTILDYNLDVGDLTEPWPKLILSEEVIHTDILVKKIGEVVPNKTYLLYPDEKVTVTIPFSGLGRQSSSSSYYKSAKLRYKATARALLYTQGRECGSDLIVECEGGQSLTEATPTSPGEDSKLCIWTFHVRGNCSLELNIDLLNITSPYSVFEIYKGSINHTRAIEYPYMVQYTNFVHWFYHGQVNATREKFIFDGGSGYVVSRVGNGTSHVQTQFTLKPSTQL